MLETFTLVILYNDALMLAAQQFRKVLNMHVWCFMFLEFN